MQKTSFSIRIGYLTAFAVLTSIAIGACSRFQVDPQRTGLPPASSDPLQATREESERIAEFKKSQRSDSTKLTQEQEDAFLDDIFGLPPADRVPPSQPVQKPQAPPPPAGDEQVQVVSPVAPPTEQSPTQPPAQAAGDQQATAPAPHVVVSDEEVSQPLAVEAVVPSADPTLEPAKTEAPVPTKPAQPAPPAEPPPNQVKNDQPGAVVVEPARVTETQTEKPIEKPTEKQVEKQTRQLEESEQRVESELPKMTGRWRLPGIPPEVSENQLCEIIDVAARNLETDFDRVAQAEADKEPPRDLPTAYLRNIGQVLASNHMSMTATQVRKNHFVCMMLPMAIRLNRIIWKQRQALLDIEAKLERNEQLSGEEETWLYTLKDEYREEEQLARLELVRALLARVDVVPVAMILSQAAGESKWGTSRFVDEAHNPFGRHALENEDGVATQNPKVRIKKYDSIVESVADYIRLLNTGKVESYKNFRAKRADLRAHGKALDPEALTNTMRAYSTTGTAYIKFIKDIMTRSNRVSKYRYNEAEQAQMNKPAEEAPQPPPPQSPPHSSPATIEGPAEKQSTAAAVANPMPDPTANWENPNGMLIGP